MILDEHGSTRSKVTAGIRIALPCFILILTSLRLYARGPQRWGWDDAWVSVACFWTVVDTPAALLIGLRYGHLDSTQLALHYVSYLTFLCSLWSCRLSILMGIARITPGSRDRRQRELMSIGVVLLGVLEMLQVGWTCASDGQWNRQTGAPECFGKKQLPITHLITSCISDFLLIVLPLHTLSDLKHSAPRIRVRLSLAFLASLCTTTLSIAAALEVLFSKAFNRFYLGQFEGYTALIVCNLPVLVVAFYRVFQLDSAKTLGRTFPPLKFAPNPDASNVKATTTDAISQSALSHSTLFSRTGTFPSSTMSSATSVPPLEALCQSKELPPAQRTFLGLFKSFSVALQADEDKCDAEVKSMHEMMFKHGTGPVLNGLPDRDRRQTAFRRRHSMSV